MNVAMVEDYLRQAGEIFQQANPEQLKRLYTGAVGVAGTGGMSRWQSNRVEGATLSLEEILPVLLKYIEVAMARAHYELLDEGEIYGEIIDLPGVYATGPSVEKCRAELQEVLEGWLILSLSRHLEIPALDGIEISCDPAA